MSTGRSRPDQIAGRWCRCASETCFSQQGSGPASQHAPRVCGPVPRCLSRSCRQPTRCGPSRGTCGDTAVTTLPRRAASQWPCLLSWQVSEVLLLGSPKPHHHRGPSRAADFVRNGFPNAEFFFWSFRVLWLDRSGKWSCELLDAWHCRFLTKLTRLYKLCRVLPKLISSALTSWPSA